MEAQGGFDGEYGVIKILSPQLRAEILGQGTLFKIDQPAAPKKKKSAPKPISKLQEKAAGSQELLNSQQKEAVEAEGGPIAVLAGPGTGKTHTLIYRIAHLVAEKGVAPRQITAVTFTNKAAEELKGGWKACWAKQLLASVQSGPSTA